jgi:hypothetical protein
MVVAPTRWPRVSLLSQALASGGGLCSVKWALRIARRSLAAPEKPPLIRGGIYLGMATQRRSSRATPERTA